MTKVAGRHTIKAGFYNNHSFKAQNVGAGGVRTWLPGLRQLRQRHEQRARHRLRLRQRRDWACSRSTCRPSKFVEGSMIYNNTEFYVQDNWKVNSRLTLDYGVRFTHQQPQYDQFQQMSNFFPEPVVRRRRRRCSTSPGCSNGAAVCSGNARNAMDPRTGQILTAPGAANTRRRSARRSRAPATCSTASSQAGDGIAKTGYTWPTLVVGPRFGVAYDVTGNQTIDPPRRRRALLRPSGRQHRVLDPGQPADRDVAGPAQRPAADARHRASARAGVPA